MQGAREAARPNPPDQLTRPSSRASAPVRELPSTVRELSSTKILQKQPGKRAPAAETAW